MRPKTSRRLRIGVVFLVAVLVALVAGSAVAVAGGGHGGHDDPPDNCWVDQFKNIDQEHGGGSVSHTYTVDGKTVTITFSWTDDKHLTVSISGGTFESLLMKAGNSTQSFSGAGPFSMYVDNPSPNSDDGLALSHMNFCLEVATDPTTTTEGPGSLKVYKKITGDHFGKDPEDFGFTVTGPEGFSKHYMFDHDGSNVINNLKPGTYTVTEDTPGYPFSVSGEGSVDVVTDDTTKITITNYGSTTTTLARGSLKIYKEITGDNPDGLTFANFYVTVTGPNDFSWYGHFDSSGRIYLTDLEPGQYTVDEDTPAYPFTAGGEGGAEVCSGSRTNVTITNNGSTTTTAAPVGSLTITKTITGDNPNQATCEDFYVTVTGPNDYNWYGHFDANCEIVLDNLAPGEYTVAEDEPGYPFTPSGEGGVTVVADRQASLDITNTGHSLGSLVITKAIEGDNPNEATCEDFYVTVTGPNDYSWYGHFDANCEIALIDLEPGEYTVTEDEPGYPFTPSGEGGVTVVADQQASLNITNIGHSLGSLMITKTIEGDNPDGLTVEDFTVVVTGPAPESTIVYNGPFDASGQVILTDLEPGTYTVTEEALGYPWIITGNGSVEVVADQEALKEILNTGSTTTSVLTDTSQVTESTTGGTESTTGGNGGTTAVQSETTVFGFIAQPDDIQTGFGGTAGGSNVALILLILSSAMLGSVLIASAVGIRAGVL